MEKEFRTEEPVSYHKVQWDDADPGQGSCGMEMENFAIQNVIHGA